MRAYYSFFSLSRFAFSNLWNFPLENFFLVISDSFYTLLSKAEKSMFEYKYRFKDFYYKTLLFFLSLFHLFYSIHNLLNILSQRLKISFTSSYLTRIAFWIHSIMTPSCYTVRGPFPKMAGPRQWRPKRKEGSLLTSTTSLVWVQVMSEELKSCTNADNKLEKTFF